MNTLNTPDPDALINSAALEYHRHPQPGKIGIALTKPAFSQWDLSLAYTPGVAEPVRKIAQDPLAAYEYTSKGNLVAVITDGSAVLGLGKMGALASKPVMEGKAVLFKRFADIDVFDIEVNAANPQEFIETVVRIAPTFGGINLEDIAAPACFEIEAALSAQLDIPVFHDDQHGTAVIVAAGLLNALELQGKTLPDANIVVLGAGAAGLACVNLLCSLGANPQHILVLDRKGVIHTERQDLNKYKEGVAVDTHKRTLADALAGADVFIGLSGPDLVPPEYLSLMAAKPVVFALSNPVPEIRPAQAHAIRPDLIMATGRSDYPNQVNNVLGFPFIFRGALDVRASTINQSMLIAAVGALRDLARLPVPDLVQQAHQRQNMTFGPDYILPSPLDPRLKQVVAPAVAQAAITSGVAKVPLPSL